MYIMYIVHKTKSNNIQGNNHFTKEQHINCCFSSRVFNNKPIYTLTTWSTLPPSFSKKKKKKNGHQQSPTCACQFTWTSAITWRPSSGVCCLSSVNFSHFKLFLRNHSANWNQSQQECSLDGPLQSYCFLFQSDFQHGCQGQ